jgi:HEAT repeat protein
MAERTSHTESTLGRTPVLPLLLLLILFVRSAPAQDRMGRQRYAKTREVSIDAAVKQLSSNDPDLRLAGAKALAASHDSHAIDALVKAVGDPDVRVQAKAIQELGDARAREATLVLTQQLLRPGAGADMQQLLLASLGKIADPMSAPALMEFLRRRLDTATRASAIYALGDIGAFESTEVLQHIAQTDEDQTVRRIAREAVEKITGPHAAPNNDAGDSPGDLPQANGLPPTQHGMR